MTLSCVTTVVLCFFRSKSQTIDSGSSHYSTLFKEHPQFQRAIPFRRSPSCQQRHESHGDSNRTLYRDGYAGFFRGILRPSPAHFQNSPPSREPFRSDGASNIASILCLSMLFSKISRKKSPDTFEKNTSSTLLNTVHHGLSQ